MIIIIIIIKERKRKRRRRRSIKTITVKINGMESLTKSKNKLDSRRNKEKKILVNVRYEIIKIIE
jgi:hypothetical protein